MIIFSVVKKLPPAAGLEQKGVLLMTGKTKNDMINDIIAGLVCTLDGEQLEVVKATFICKMQGYDIHEVVSLPAVETVNNEFILKRFAIDMIAKGTKQKEHQNLYEHSGTVL